MHAALAQFLGLGQGIDHRPEGAVEIPHHQHVAGFQLFQHAIIDGTFRGRGGERLDMQFVAEGLEALYLAVMALVRRGNTDVCDFFHANQWVDGCRRVTQSSPFALAAPPKLALAGKPQFL